MIRILTQEGGFGTRPYEQGEGAGRHREGKREKYWIPACAGMTNTGAGMTEKPRMTRMSANEEGGHIGPPLREKGKMREKKVFGGRLEFKADGVAGSFRAVYATLNVKDLDGDVTLPGAFSEGQPVRISSWQHGWGNLPVGRGEIHADQKEAWVDGQFFMDVPAAVDHYKVIKGLGELAEWSYSFEVLDAADGAWDGGTAHFLKKMDVIEVAPVMRGAGIDTRTVSMKAAMAGHTTPTSEGAWDGPANTTNVRSGEDEAYYRKIYAWMDPEGDPTVKSTYRFIHHEVSQDGTPGAANIWACQSAIGVLNGGRGGTTIPDADRKGVYNHLARHLKDAKLTPPDLKALKEGARHTAAEYKQIQQLHDLAIELGATCSAAKSGRRHNAKDAEDIQSVHDLAIGLGATCKAEDSADDGEGEPKDEAGDPGKSSKVTPRDIQRRIEIDTILLS